MLHVIELDRGKQALQSRIMMQAPTYEAETAQELFRKFRTGDDAAFTALYQMHNQKLYAYCTKILSHSMAAKDIVHTMWEKIIASGREP